MEQIFEILNLDLKEKSYNIYIGKNLNESILKYTKFYPKFCIITNTTIYNIYKEHLKNFNTEYIIQLPDGEKYKDITSVNEIFNHLINYNFGRDSLLIAFGGGVIGDITGFAASTFMRGIDYIQMPTTLLAMVDSSVGGKTAVNFNEGKNLVGSFYQPKAVFIDINFLNTLPSREFNAGLAEIIKYGFIADKNFFYYLIDNKEKIKKLDEEVITNIIAKSCLIKSHIVSIDEKEQGLRSILNFGHTLGHAIESYTNYNYYLHGEAVAIGILGITKYLVNNGILSNEIYNLTKDFFKYFNIPFNIPKEFETKKIIEKLVFDKKNKNGKNKWVLLKQLGVPVWEQHLTTKEVEKIIMDLKNEE